MVSLLYLLQGVPLENLYSVVIPKSAHPSGHAFLVHFLKSHIDH
jgi:hypothetical protein